MLAFSFILSLYHIITNTLSYRFVTSPTPTYPLLSLSHLPETLHLRFSNSVYIYMWFYSLIHTTIYISLSTFINFKHQSITPVYHSRPMRRCSQSKIIFILLYILANFCLVAANYHDLLPLSSLLSMPSLTLLYGLHHHIQHYNNHPFIPPYSLSRHTHLLSQPSDPSSLSTESSKLAYLYAWQCAQASSTKLMNFSPRGTPICIDTGASCFISNNKADFLHLEQTSHTVLKGIGSGLSIEGTGTLCWKIVDDSGNEISLHIHNSLYVPLAPMRLLSPQTIAQQTCKLNDGFQAFGTYGSLHFVGRTKTIHYNNKNNLPIFFTASNLSNLPQPTTLLATHLSAYNSVDDIFSTDTLTAIQRKLLLKHQQLGHLSMTKIQQLAKAGHLGASCQNLSTCDPPMCKACVQGKQHKRPIINTDLQPLDSSHRQPGDCVSCDQLKSTQPGLIPVFKGSPSTSFYHASTLFVDHASHLLHFIPYISTGTGEAVSAKLRFELFASSFHCPIRQYHANNGKESCSLQ